MVGANSVESITIHENSFSYFILTSIRETRWERGEKSEERDKYSDIELFKNPERVAGAEGGPLLQYFLRSRVVTEQSLWNKCREALSS